MPREAETITVTDLRVGTREILENAHFRGRHYIVVRAGQPMVAIVGVEEYRRLIEARDKAERLDSGLLEREPN
jgi:prevent-host-death family protein